MSVTSSVTHPATSEVPTRFKHLSFQKYQPRTYLPWRNTMSERRLNSIFETQILPGLSRQFEQAFTYLPTYEQEDAIQDAICQALEAYKVLRLGENGSRLFDPDETSAALAAYATGRYLSGIRFGSPYIDACL